MNIDKTVDALNKALTEKVKTYNNLVAASHPSDHSSENSVVKTLFSEIEKTLEFITYYLPQKYFEMEEEDASDFLLYVHPKFKEIVLKFRNNSNDFCAYFYCVLKRKAKAFKAQKAKNNSRETLILNSFEVRETYTCYSNLKPTTPKIENSDSIKRLKYSIKNSITIRRRFFIYLLSICPFIEVGMIEELCNFSKINTKQMMALNNYLTKKIKGLMSEKNNLIEMRNLIFEKTLEAQKEVDLLKSCGIDSTRTETYLESLNERIDKKNNQIENTLTHVPYPILADLLNINVSTVSTQVYYIKKFISWCCHEEFDIESNIYEFAIGSNLMKDLIFGKWKNDRLTGNLREFLPMKEFNIDPSVLGP